ncbi:MAG: DUF4390 domain-containing protein [Neisseria sp.]|uniref:DUF4390 domain-containing protein n=1 Tax=Neisseria sp. TaxID=192066 RepID=UPI0026DD726B|nr:DUF4390 domain-containing protein [Neisseria sp.]MDO4641396.1 DUF4390 domain-containing protein [Neisseria sp.]
MAFTTRLSKSSKHHFLLALLIALIPFASLAEGISVLRAQARLTGDGQLAVSSRFKTELPDQLKQALQQGVPLHFTLNYQLSAPTLAAYKFRLNQIVGSDNQVTYKLSYHPLTNRYRISVGTFSTEYSNLETALRGIGAISDWKVLPLGTLSGESAENIQSEIRLTLSTAKLPKPFQINAINSKSWQLDSGWKDLTVSTE